MRLVIILFLGVFFLYVKGQTTQVPNYSCNQNNDSVEFTLSSSSHSAWQPTSNCSLQQCQLSSNNTNSCLLPPTPCFDYLTLNNSSYCAPGIMCSILEPCNNMTYTCTSNTSVCVVNSCCSPQAVCLPLSATNFCILAITTSIITTSTAATSTTSTTTTISSSTRISFTTTTSSTSSTSTSSRTSTSTSSTTSKRTTSTSSTTSKRTTTTTSRTTSTTTKTVSKSRSSLKTFLPSQFPTTTTTTTATTTTAYSCSAPAPDSLATLTGNTNTSWTQYTYHYKANKTDPILIFGVDSSNSIYLAVDSVSVVNTDNTSVELLVNPSFANSSTNATGWNIWCSYTCGSGSGGTIISSGCLTNNCYKSQCDAGGLDYLAQGFSATVGRNYTISFWFLRVRFGPSSASVILFVGII